MRSTVLLILLLLAACNDRADGPRTYTAVPENAPANALANEPAQPGKLPTLGVNEAGYDGSVHKLVDAAGRVKEGRVILVFATAPIKEDRRAALTNGRSTSMLSGMRELGAPEQFLEVNIELKDAAKGLAPDNVKSWFYILFNFAKSRLGNDFEGAEGLTRLEGDLKKDGKVRLSLLFAPSPPNEEDETYGYFRVEREVSIFFAD